MWSFLNVLYIIIKFHENIFTFYLWVFNTQNGPSYGPATSVRNVYRQLSVDALCGTTTYAVDE